MSITINYLPFNGNSRFTLLLCAECGFNYTLKQQDIIEYKANKYKILPSINVDDKLEIKGSLAIIQYFRNIGSNYLFSDNDYQAASVCEWIINDFNPNLVEPIINELILENFNRNHSIDSSLLVDCTKKLSSFFEYIENILSYSIMISSDNLSYVDLLLASHISLLDYVNYIKWSEYKYLYVWYMRVKSRPSFLTILNEHYKGLQPPKHYRELDF